jgi:cobalt-zinc-cadmium efflux system protein
MEQAHDHDQAQGHDQTQGNDSGAGHGHSDHGHGDRDHSDHGHSDHDHSDHGHDHSHAHGFGHHHHPINLKQVNRAFVFGIVLNFLFVIIEVIVGLSIRSLSLLSDAGHNLADVASLAMALVAIRLLRVKPNENYTYGYKKTTILVALLNAAILLLSIGAIGYEALHRLMDPQPLPGKTISIVAAIGIGINAVTAMLFFRNKESDLNVRGAFLHLLSDAIVSAGLVIGGFVIFYTHQYWIDPVLSLVVAVIILFSTWQLLRDSLRLSLDGVPAGIEIKKIRESIAAMKDVKDFHHIHIWAISTTENALTAHLVVDRNSEMDAIEKLKHQIKHELLHKNIQHATLEIEMEDAPCDEPDC